jgi:ABC-type lipoprotein release transport system permease subunit
MTTAGVAVGLAVALIGGRFVSRLLFDVSPHDPIVLVAATVVLIAVAIVACLIPAWRAMRVDPVVALRSE